MSTFAIRLAETAGRDYKRSLKRLKDKYKQVPRNKKSRALILLELRVSGIELREIYIQRRV